MPELIAYKIMTDEELGLMRREGAFRGSPVDVADGFIHLSTAAQLPGTIERHFSGRTGLVLAAIDLTKLGDIVRWETSRGGQLFPHVYGVLPAGAVIAAGSLAYLPDGSPRLPGAPR